MTLLVCLRVRADFNVPVRAHGGNQSPNMADPLTSPYVLPLLFFFI